MYRKLSPAEISAVIAKIRSKYDEYCTKYFKPRKIKEQFENRYLGALKQGVDISNFLLAEIGAIEELIKTEEKKIEQAPVNTRQAEPKPNFADKIIEENQKKIAGYPSLSFHKDANPELKHLLGALNLLYEKHFPALHTLFRNITTNVNLRELSGIETRLRLYAYLGNDRIPSGLARYYTLLNRFPRDYRAMEREEKEYILESAFLLHDLNDLFEAIVKQHALREEKQQKELGQIHEYAAGIITDFRLKDLKRKK